MTIQTIKEGKAEFDDNERGQFETTVTSCIACIGNFKLPISTILRFDTALANIRAHTWQMVYMACRDDVSEDDKSEAMDKIRDVVLQNVNQIIKESYYVKGCKDGNVCNEAINS